MRSPARWAKLLTIPAALAVVALPAAEAVAGSGYGQLIVNPGTVTAGQTVSILGVCPTNGSPFEGVYSTAFAGGAASAGKGSVNFSGSATIASSAAPGTYTVAAKCGAGSPSVTITVAAAGSAPAAQAAATRPGAPAGAQSTPAAVAPAQTSTAAAAGAAGAAGAGSSAVPGANASTPASSRSPKAAATDAAVTSTGIVRVGLAGNSKPLLSASLVESFVALVAAAGAVGFLMFQRRRKSHTHNS